MFIRRKQQDNILKAIDNNPVTELIGPRQCGKSTLAKHILSHYNSSIYLDLERPSDLQKINNAEWFLSSQKGKLICIDEVQRSPELFPLIRSLVDEWGGNGHFLILGSASRDLLQQSSETLAGRISYQRLTPFLYEEINTKVSIENYFSRGGFPRSILPLENKLSFEWRENFITTFLERDLLQWKNFTPATMHRLWQMLAHLNGQTADYSYLAKALEISSPTVKSYIDLLASTYMVEILRPYTSNLGKRLVKSPKVYINDSGITAALLGLSTFEALLGHPSYGAIWEQIVLSQLKGNFPKAKFFHYRTSNGNEVDIIMSYRQKIYVIECKATASPKVGKGFYYCLEDIQPTHTYIASLTKDSWSMSDTIKVVNLKDLITEIQSFEL